MYTYILLEDMRVNKLSAPSPFPLLINCLCSLRNSYIITVHVSNMRLLPIHAYATRHILIPEPGGEEDDSQTYTPLLDSLKDNKEFIGNANYRWTADIHINI